MRLFLIAAAAAATAAIAAEDEALSVPLSEADLVGCGTRSILWKKLYGLSLYQEPSAGEVIVMDVLHEGDLPGGLPDDWPPKLRRTVDEATIAQIDAAFGLIRPSSRVEIVYDAPTNRSRMVVDGQPAVEVEDRVTYDAIRAMWFGDDPIDAKLKRDILAGRCEAS